MINTSWLDALDHELAVSGVDATQRADILVETEGFLTDSGLEAYDHFGPAEDYAYALAAALERPLARRSESNSRSIISACDVSKSYRGRTVLDDVSFQAQAASVVVLTGPNGAGKSTLLRIVAGLEAADSGTVKVDGAVGYVPQEGGLDPYLRPSDHFELFGASAGSTRASARGEGNRLARELGWDAEAAPIVNELSGGTRQKLSVIVALLSEPEVLLLDEPYQGMDADSARRFWELLWSWQERGGTSVVSSHSQDALRKASHVVEIAGLSVR